MNWKVRKYTEERAEKLEDLIDTKKYDIAYMQEELDGLLSALGEADMEDLNKQFERSV